MVSTAIRNISEDTPSASTSSASAFRGSADDELQRMLIEAERSPSSIKAGDLLAAFGRKYGSIEVLPRDPSPVEPAAFE